MREIPLNAESDITLQLERYHADCYGWALHCCNRDGEKASEVLQTAYLKILEKQNTFRGASTFKTWVFIVIKNTARDARREQMKIKQKIFGEKQLPDVSYESDSEGRLDRKQQNVFFLKALNQLSERQRQIMQLVFYNEFSINQSAEVLNISQGSARKHYDRAKKALAEWFRKKGVEEYK